MPPPTSTSPAAPGSPAFDLATALEFLDGSMDLLREVVEQVRKDAPQGLRAVRDALERGAVTDVAREAHKLKGSFSCLGAAPATDAARALEEAARAGDVALLPELVRALDAAYARLRQAFRDLLGV